MRTRRAFLAALALLGLALIPGCDRVEHDKPNIVVILADDLGYADISLHGSRDITTPHIDSIARKGVQFTSGYVTFPACAPSRASLLTGRHHLRIGFPTNPDRVRPTREGNPIGLPPSEITLAERLRSNGYRTGAFGKWHLGKEPQLHPLEQGFDEFYGFLGSLHGYFDTGRGRRGWDGMLRGRESVEETEYLTYAFVREAVEFIERNQDSPFFVYLAFNAVHTPLMDDKRRPKSARNALAGSNDPRKNRATYVRMVEAMDRSVGRVLDKLRELELEDDTLVFFLGGTHRTGAYDNTPLRGFKGTVYEGGVRVPFLMQWPRRLAAGTKYDEPVSATDILPTSVVAAGDSVPGDGFIDGVDLAPFLNDQQHPAPHDALFFNFGNQFAVRAGSWKLILHDSQSVELYDVVDDISETIDLATENPAVVSDLTRRLQTWKKHLPDPLFEPDPEQWRAWREQLKSRSNYSN